MRIYLDVVFVLNGTINYLLLSASARLMGDAGYRVRRILAALLGAAYACMTFLPGFSFLSGILWRCAALGLMVLTAFGIRAKTIQMGVIVLALSFALAGLLLMVSNVLGAQVWLLEGSAFYAVGAGSLILTAGALYLGAWLVLQGTMCHTGGQIVSARLELAQHSVNLRFLLDSGNTLRDPFTGNPVPVIEKDAITGLLPEAVLLPAGNPSMALTKLHKLRPELSVRLIPYRAVGTHNGLLPAVRFDALTVEGRRKNAVYVAISPTAVSECGNYVGLIGEGEWI